MARRLLDYDPLTRTSVYHDYDHDSKVTTIHEIQDQTPIVESLNTIKRVSNSSRIVSGNSRLNDYERAGIEAEWMHVARISNEDQAKWLEEGIDLYKINQCEWTKKKVYQKLNWSGKEKWRTGNAKI